MYPSSSTAHRKSSTPRLVIKYSTQKGKRECSTNTEKWKTKQFQILKKGKRHKKKDDHTPSDGKNWRRDFLTLLWQKGGDGLSDRTQPVIMVLVWLFSPTKPQTIFIRSSSLIRRRCVSSFFLFDRSVSSFITQVTSLKFNLRTY